MISAQKSEITLKNDFFKKLIRRWPLIMFFVNDDIGPHNAQILDLLDNHEALEC